MRTGPAAGDHLWMGTRQSGCSGGKGRVSCFVFVGNEQTIGLGLLCLSPAFGAGEPCTGEQQARGEAGTEGEAWQGKCKPVTQVMKDL